MKLPAIVLLILFATAASAQKTQKKPVKCHIPSDSAITLKVTLAQAQAWADSLPLQVICDDLKTYKLQSFNFTVITLNPFQTKDFGTGNGGIPILARKAINQLQPKDAIILKNATYLGDKGVEQTLPVISISIKDDGTSKPQPDATMKQDSVKQQKTQDASDQKSEEDGDDEN
jgi:hypothetical protein